MSARKQSRKSPRRKAGRKPRRKKERKLTFRLEVDAQVMIVEYEADWSGGDIPYGHFEFRSPHEPPRPILVSDTGYLSHFAPMDDVKALGPERYAREFVIAVLDSACPDKRKAEASGQLSLF